MKDNHPCKDYMKNETFVLNSSNLSQLFKFSELEKWGFFDKYQKLKVKIGACANKFHTSLISQFVSVSSYQLHSTRTSWWQSYTVAMFPQMRTF